MSSGPTQDRNFFLKVEHRKRVNREYGPELGHAGIALYELLCLHANSHTAKTYIGRRTICDQLKMTPRRFQSLVSQMVRLRLVAVENAKGAMPTTYTILPLPDREELLPFDPPAVPNAQVDRCVVVPDSRGSGSQIHDLRFPNGARNKEELNAETNRGTETPEVLPPASAATHFSLGALAQLVIANLKIPGSVLLEMALAKAIGIESDISGKPPNEVAQVILSALELYQAVRGQRWTLVMFVQEAKYRLDPAEWSTYGKHAIDSPAFSRSWPLSSCERRAARNVSAAERAIQLDRVERERRSEGVDHEGSDPTGGPN